MRDVLSDLLAIWRSDETAGLATVVATFHSAPRAPGAAMVVAPDRPRVRFGVRRVRRGRGLRIGVRDGPDGEADPRAVRRQRRRRVRGRAHVRRHLDVFVEPVLAPRFPHSQTSPTTSRSGVRWRWRRSSTTSPGRVGQHLVIRPDDVSGTLGSDRLDAAVVDDGRGLLAGGRTAVLAYGPDGQRRGEGLRVFVASYAPPPRMLVFGAIDFAAAVARQGKFLGYRVTRVTRASVRDCVALPDCGRGRGRLAAPVPRSAGRRGGSRRPHGDLCAHPRSQVDVPLLAVALRLPDVGYVGAMGSQRTTATDWTGCARPVSPTWIWPGCRARSVSISGPRTPEETAVSIAAEIIARRWGGGGLPLRDLRGRIHHERNG